ncbi:Hypothetical predicted protein [Cloeon dipterum]|uniref:Uncharacterized protein n=1 Tax=Cloeon dipterum TaxID=197152 RepID=A0A8S1DGE0_9INSE|nr:Hypothetical predicted protein [Cloeon dipterum]
MKITTKLLISEPDGTVSIEKFPLKNQTDKNESTVKQAFNAFIRKFNCNPVLYSSYQTKAMLKNLLLTAENAIKEFHLGPITNLHKNEPNFDYEVLDLGPTNTSTLTIEFNKLEAFFRPIELEEKMWETLCTMEKLVLLKVDKYSFSLDQIISLCWCLECLKHVEVKVSPQHPHPFQDVPGKSFLELLKMCMGRLRVFNFSTVPSIENRSSEFHQAMVQFFVQHRPNLEELGDRHCFTDMTMACQRQREISRLHNVSVLLDSTKRLPSNNFRMFPYIKLLNIKWDDRVNCPPIQEFYFKPLLSFPMLTKLQFFNLTSLATLEFFLDHYGHQLEMLNVELNPRTTNLVRNVRFSMIRSLCPKLQTLIMTKIANPVDDSLWSFSQFAHLQTLYLDVECSWNDLPVRLSDILLAPKLRKVILCSLHVSEEQLQKLSDMVENGSILRHIISFVLIINPVRSGNEKKLNKAGNRLRNVMQEYRPEAFFKFKVMSMV